MKIKDIFKDGKTVFSFEISPPKKDGTIDNLNEILEQLSALSPDFISVTYGAGGSVPGFSTPEVAAIIKDKFHTETIAHLTCVNSTVSDIDRAIEELNSRGVENVLALRGDINPDIPPKTDFTHASDLIEYLKKHSNLGISGACYPEGHLESESLDADIENLKRKVDVGAEHLISQLFFENEQFYLFREKARAKGITVPIEAGIMPCGSAGQIRRMVTMCGASLPRKFVQMLNKYENDPESLRDAGIAYAIDQIVDLAANGVDGIHLYTMNNPYIARQIRKACYNIIKA